MGRARDLVGLLDFLAEVATRYGTVASWSLLGRRFVLIGEPALIDELLVAKSRDFIKGRGVQRLRALLGEGLLTAEQPVHLPHRRMLQPAFHRERIAGYGRRMVTLTGAMLDGWRDGETIRIDAAMTSLTLAIACDTLFSANVGERAGSVHDNLTELMEAFPALLSAVGGMMEKLPFVPSTRRFRRARARLDDVVYALIEERRRSDPATWPDDFLSMLLASRDDAHGGLDDRQVRDEAMTIFLAGHETTANALAWSCDLLARNPDVARALAADCEAVLGEREPSPDDLPQLRLARDVLAESMRLYPPAWITGRIAVRDTRLGNWPIAKGTIVLACQWLSHRDARLFADPLAFRPERWSTTAAKLPAGAYFPFGGGNRRCIGEPFAWMEGTLVLAHLAQRFSLELVEAESVPIQPLVTLRPGRPIRLRVRGRSRVPAARTAPAASI
jgi:cytochrome P450